MKKQIITIILALFGLSLYAQPAGLNTLYYTYKGEKGVIAMKVPGFVMKLAGRIGDLDQEERQLMRSMRSVRLLTVEDGERYPGLNFTKEVDLSRMKGGYQLLLEVHEDDEDVIIVGREKKGKITDLIVIVGGSDNAMVHVRGRMDSDLLENLAGVAGVNELHYTTQL